MTSVRKLMVMTWPATSVYAVDVQQRTGVYLRQFRRLCSMDGVSKGGGSREWKMPGTYWSSRLRASAGRCSGHMSSDLSRTIKSARGLTKPYWIWCLGCRTPVYGDVCSRRGVKSRVGKREEKGSSSCYDVHEFARRRHVGVFVQARRQCQRCPLRGSWHKTTTVMAGYSLLKDFLVCPSCSGAPLHL